MEPGGLNIQELMQQAQRLMSAQQELAEAEATGTAGGGLVTATVNGHGEVTGISIDPKAIDTDDPAETAETVADLVLAAIRDAGHAVADMQASMMGPLAAGIGGGIPGLGGPGEGAPGLPGMPAMPNLPGFPGFPAGPPAGPSAADVPGESGDETARPDDDEGEGGPKRPGA